MRTFPICWDKTLAKLGFRRRVSKQRLQRISGRKVLFEQLEAREMLTGNTYTVTTLDDIAMAGTSTDDNFWSLREAITKAATIPGRDTINFAPGLTGTITLGSLGHLNLNSDVDLLGPSGGEVTLAADGTHRVISVPTGISVKIADLKITGGGGVPDGGGIHSTGDLTLERVTVTGNTATNAGGGVRAYGVGSAAQLHIIDSTIEGNIGKYGAGVDAQLGTGVLEIRGSLIANNRAATSETYADAGGVRFNSQATVGSTIVNSTISNNTSRYSGGIRVWGDNSAALSIVNSTVTENQSLNNETGAGVTDASSTAANKITVHNSIVAGNLKNTSATASPGDVKGSLNTASSYNIFGSGAGTTTPTGAGNQIGSTSSPIGPQLAPLADNGGPTKSHALLAYSLALNAGNNAAATAAGISTDQRGRSRFVDLTGTASGVTDIGAYEQGLVVSTTVDESDGDYSAGDLSLREALALAAVLPGKQEISFAPGLTGTISLGASGQLNVTSPVDILGPGVDALTIDAHGASRAFYLSDETASFIDVSLSGLTITGGYSDTEGGGILNREILALRAVKLVGNEAKLGGGLYSYNSVNSVGGSVTVFDSTFTDNTAKWGGGAYIRSSYAAGVAIFGTTFNDNHAIKGYNGDGSWMAGSGSGGGLTLFGSISTVPLTVANSTFSSNVAENVAGGLATSSSNVATLRATNLTVVGNLAGDLGGGLYRGAGTIVLDNSLVAQNQHYLNTTAQPGDVGGALNSASSNNLIGNGSGGLSASLGNILGTPSNPIDPLIGPLADNGGPTKTHALLVGSPALNAGANANASAAGLGTDQRGRSRFVDLTGTASGVTDIGAYEQGLVVSTAVDEPDGDYSAGELSLREAIALAAVLPGRNEIEFAPSLAGTSIVLSPSLGQLTLASDVSILGLGVDDLTIAAQGGHRVFYVNPRITATIADLTITGGGNVTNGGGVYNAGDLTLDKAAVVDNQTDLTSTGANNGGGVFSATGSSLHIIDTTIDGNQGRWGGGVAFILGQAGVLDISGSTLSHNSGIGRDANGDPVGGLGGGLLLTSDSTATGRATIVNSTFSGNASTEGAGLSIREQWTKATIVNATIYDNHTSDPLDDNAALAGGYAGGIQAFASTGAPTVTLHNTILAGNTATSTVYPDVWGDVAGSLFDQSSYNLLGVQNSTVTIGSQSHSGLFHDPRDGSGDALGNIVGGETSPIDPVLSELADFGGATLTHVFLQGTSLAGMGSLLVCETYGTLRSQTGITQLMAQAATIGSTAYVDEPLVVGSLEDDGDDRIGVDGIGAMSLREAIRLAKSRPGPDEITFAEGLAGTIVLKQGELLIDSDVTIVGPGADLLTISGNAQSRVFEVLANQEVTIRGLKIAQGDASTGGGVANHGILTLDQVEVTENHATQFGSGVFSDGTLSVANSTFAGNKFSYVGGGIYATTVYIENSTFSDNAALYDGGAVYASYLTMTNSTVTANSAAGSSGGGIYVTNVFSGSTISNSIVAGNTAAPGQAQDIYATSFVAGGYNVVGSVGGETYLLEPTNHYVTSVADILAPLGDYGGPTRTHALLPTATVAIDQANDSIAPFPTDQRGFALYDEPSIDSESTRDIGAFEYSPNLVVTTLADQGIAPGLLSLRQALALANLDPDLDEITFAEGLAGTIVLKHGELLIDSDVTIVGPGADLLTISGNEQSRVFEVAVNQEATIRGLEITQGYDSNGGGVSNYGTLTLDEIAVTNNKATQFGSGVFSNGLLTVRSSTFAGNNWAYLGGGIYGTTVSVSNSTFSDNAAWYYGGAIYADWLTLTNSTLARNSAASGAVGEGGGIYVVERGTLFNSIVVGNTVDGASEALADVSGSFDSSSSHNIFGPGVVSPSGPFFPDNYNRTVASVTDILAPLGDYGGPTRTHALLRSAAVAIDQANDSIASFPTDQRGFVPYDDQSILSDNIRDIGAFEYSPNLVVTTLADQGVAPGQMSLRQALALANLDPDHDEIRFAEGLAGTIVLQQGELLIDSDVTIVGPGADVLSIDAQSKSRVFNVHSASQVLTVSIRGLTISGGDAGLTGDGGGIWSSENLTLDSVAVIKNVASSGGGIQSNNGSLAIRNSTIADNNTLSVDGLGGGINSYTSSLELINTTVSHNSASISGGGVYVYHQSESSIEIVNSTITANRNSILGVDAAGLALWTDGGPRALVFNSIIVGNTTDGASSSTADVSGSFDSASSHNIFGPGVVSPSGPFSPDNANQTVESAAKVLVVDRNGVPVLTSNGGPVPTHALFAGSPAIDAGLSISGLSRDARGFARYDDPDVPGLLVFDIGAYEWQGIPRIVVNTDRDDALFVPGELTLRQAIKSATPGSIISFDPHVKDLNKPGAEITLGEDSDLIIDKSLVIDATMLSYGLTIRAYDVLEDEDPNDGIVNLVRLVNANGGRVFQIEGGQTEVTLRGLTLTGADAPGSGGAINSKGALLTLDRVQVSHNAAPSPPGFEILGYKEVIEPVPEEVGAGYHIKDVPILGPLHTNALGGGIYATGDVVILNSRFVNNATADFQHLTPEQSAAFDAYYDAMIDSLFPDEQLASGIPESFSDLLQQAGTIYAGDIYSLGDLTIKDTIFTTEDVPGMSAGDVRYIAPNDYTLALGGIYATHRRIADALVEISNTQFINTRGMVFDNARISPWDAYGPGEPSGGLQYEVRNLAGGDLSYPLNNSTSTTVLGGDLFPPTLIDSADFKAVNKVALHSEIVYEQGADQNEFDPADFSELARFDIREVYGDDSAGQWIHASVLPIDDRDGSSEYFDGDEFALIAVSDVLTTAVVSLQVEPGLARGQEVADFDRDGSGVPVLDNQGFLKLVVHVAEPIATSPYTFVKSTIEDVVAAVNAQGTFRASYAKLSTASDSSDLANPKLVIDIPLASLAKLDAFRRAVSTFEANLTNVEIVDPRGGMFLKHRKSWEASEQDGDIPYEVPNDLSSDPTGPDQFTEERATVRIYGADATLNGVTFRNGDGLVGISAWRSDLQFVGGSFLPSSTSFFNGMDSAIRVYQSHLTVADAVFAEVGMSRGLIHADASSSVSIDGSSFLNNVSTGGGVIEISPLEFNVGSYETGVPLRFQGELAIRNTSIVGADGSAVNIYIPTLYRLPPPEPTPGDDDYLFPKYARIAGNNVPYRLTIEGSTIQDNFVAYGAGGNNPGFAHGGGVNLTGLIDAFIADSTIAGNRAGGDWELPDPNFGVDYWRPAGYGGGVFAKEIHSLRIENSTISNNYAATAGGGVFVLGVDQVEMTNVTVSGNRAGLQGGGIFVVGGAVNNGQYEYNDLNGVFVPQNDEVITLVNTIVAGNHAFGLKDEDSDYPTHVDNGPFAVDFQNTHDVWFSHGTGLFVPEDYHALSADSSHNLFGVAPSAGGNDPELPISNGDSRGNRIGTPMSPLDPGLAVMADYGGATLTNGLLLGDNRSLAIDNGIALPLIKPAWVESSSYRTDESPAYDLLSEAVTLTEDIDVSTHQSSEVTLSGDRTPDIDGRGWKTHDPSDDLFAPRFGELTFGFHSLQAIDRIVLWDFNFQNVEISFWDESSQQWGGEITATLNADSTSRTIFFDPANDNQAPGGVVYTSPASALLDGGFVATNRVRLRILDSASELSQARLGEVRFGAQSLQDQRGGGFNRISGSGIDIGAYESPASYNSMPAKPAPYSDPAYDAFDIIPSSASDDVDSNVTPGHLSLREAIILANLHTGLQTIGLPATLNGGTLSMTRGELRIADSLTIEYLPGVAPTNPRFTIDSSASHASIDFVNAASPNSPSRVYDDPSTSYPFSSILAVGAFRGRVLNIDDGQDIDGSSPLQPITVKLTGLDLTGGFVLGSGGGIRTTENLELIDSRVHDNVAYRTSYASTSGHYGYDPEYLLPRGGGVYSTQGSVTVDNSAIVGNVAVVAGAGIYVEPRNSYGFLLRDSLVESNTLRLPVDLSSSAYNAQTVPPQPIVDAPFALTPTTFDRITSVHGAGIAIVGAGNAEISDSIIQGNAALALSKEFTLASRNFLDPLSERVIEHLVYDARKSYGGGVYISGSDVLIKQSTISGNEAMEGGGLFVVGALNSSDAARGYAHAELLNSTVSNNIAAIHLSPLSLVSHHDPSGQLIPAIETVGLYGAGVAARGNANVEVRHSTITENRIDGTYPTDFETAAGIYFPNHDYYSGAGSTNIVDDPYGGWLTIDHSVVAGNSAPLYFGPNHVITSSNAMPKGNGTDPIPSSDIFYFAYSSSVAPQATQFEDPATNEILKITNSLIGDNRWLVYLDDPHASQVAGDYRIFGYTQSPLVDPSDMTTPLEWSEGGVPRPDVRGNLIGGPLLGPVDVFNDSEHTRSC